MRDMPLPSWLRTSITRVCPIPPKPRMQNLIHTPAFRSRVVPFAIFLIVFPLICIPLVITYVPLYPEGWRLPARLTRDFILVDRNPPSQPGRYTGLFLEGHDQLIIQDCIVYTVPSRAPQTLQDVVIRGTQTKDISVTDYANLTIRNVTFIPYAYISASKQASVTLINCSNYVTDWSQNTRELGRCQLLPYGVVSVSDDATLHLQNASVGIVTLHDDADCTISHSRIDTLSVNTTSRIPITDSEIDALHGDRELIDAIGTTHVSAGVQTIVDIYSAVETRIVHAGDSIQANFTITNLGNTTLVFSSGLDRFTMEMGNQNVWDDPYPYDQPIPPEYQFPPILEPSENFTQTLMWHQPPLAPGTYELRCAFYLKSLSSTYSTKSYLFGPCGFYTITILEET